MTDTLTIADVLDAIYTYDARELELAEEAIRERKNELGLTNDESLTMQSVKIGDTLFFNGNTNNYLRGLPVEVVSKARTRVVVKVPDEPRYRRFQGKTQVRCPLTILSRNPY